MFLKLSSEISFSTIWYNFGIVKEVNPENDAMEVNVAVFSINLLTLLKKKLITYFINEISL